MDNLFGTPIFARHIKKNIKSKNIISVAPDVGGTERARALGKLLDVGLAIVDKRRPAPGKSQVMNVIGNVKDKTCILVDDIIDSGGTIVNAAKALKDRGAKEVYVYITHGVLSGDAINKIKKSSIKKLVITDTIDNLGKTNKAKNIENEAYLSLGLFLFSYGYSVYDSYSVRLKESGVKLTYNFVPRSKGGNHLLGLNLRFEYNF